MRQEHIACVKLDDKKSWCGNPIQGFRFNDVDHAALNGKQEGRLITCPECLEVIVKALSNGQ